MNVLVLGGTRFLGRALTESLLKCGHAVTLFHRGRSLPDGLPGAASVIGDRTLDLTSVAGRDWDAVIDTSGTVPAVVEQAILALRERAARYVFISSVSVYRDDDRPPIGERSALVDVPPGLPSEVTPEAYAPQKVRASHCADYLYQFGLNDEYTRDRACRRHFDRRPRRRR